MEGLPADIPNYDFCTHSRMDQWTLTMPTTVIFFEGILAFYDERIRNMMHYKFFIHCDGNDSLSIGEMISDSAGESSETSGNEDGRLRMSYTSTTAL